MLATGLPASPGAAVGQIVFTADEAVEKFSKDKQTHAHPGARRDHAGRHCTAWKSRPAFSPRAAA